MTFGFIPPVVDSKPYEVNSCNCIGPQNGEPRCPCDMRGVTIKDGRYIKVTDLGPAPTKESDK